MQLDSQSVSNRFNLLELQSKDGQLLRFATSFKFERVDRNWYHPVYPGLPNSKWDMAGRGKEFFYCDRCETRFLPEDGKMPAAGPAAWRAFQPDEEAPETSSTVACWCCEKDDDVRRSHG